MQIANGDGGLYKGKGRKKQKSLKSYPLVVTV